MTAGGAVLNTVRAITCPACGGGLVVPAGRRAARCPSCRARCALLGEVAEPRQRIVPRVEGTRASWIVRNALARWPVDAGAAAAARFSQPELVYVPMCEFEGLEAGAITVDKGVQAVRGGRADYSTGKLRYLDPEGNEVDAATYYHRRLERLHDTRIILTTHRACVVAGGPEDWRVDAVDLEALRDDEDARFETFGSAETAAAESEGALVLPPRQGRADARAMTRRQMGATGRVDFLAEEVRIVFVPVWLLRWRIGNHPYTFVVDALHGRILCGRAPEARRRGALFVGLVAAFIGFPAGKIVANAGPVDGRTLAFLARAFGEAPLAAVVVAILFLLPIAYAWGEFRYRGEVVFSPGGVQVKKIARPAQTGIERFIQKLCDALDDYIMKPKEDR